MRRPVAVFFVAAATVFGSSALAQGGDLRGVTMRVLDDLSGVDAVIIELDASNTEDEEAAQRSRARRDAADSAERKDAESAARESDRFDEPKELHVPDDDEPGEGRLEDRDVEQPGPTSP